MTINTAVALKFTFTLVATINRNDNFKITFPAGTTYSYSTGIFGTSLYTEPPTISGQVVEVYHSTSVALSQQYSSAYTLVIQNFIAPPSTEPTTAI